MALKNSVIEKFIEYIAIGAAILSEIETALLGLLILVCIETLLGTKLALRENRFNWKEFFLVFTKIVWFALALITGAVANWFVYLSFIDWVPLFAGICAAYEVRQIAGKVDILAGTNIAQTVRELLDNRLLNITNRAKKQSELEKENI